MPGHCRLSMQALMAVTVSLVVPLSAFAKNQWDINHGASNPPMDPRFAPGGSASGYVPEFVPGFWDGKMSQRIPVGTVLTAILENDLHSGKNKQGDVFTILLPQGFVQNGNQLIPPNSKILGSVVSAVPSKGMRMGSPGRLDISLQSLVFPDGRHFQIFAFVEANPNFAMKKAPKMKHMGASLADYGQSVASMGLNFVSGPGFMMNRRNRGLDLRLDQGEPIAVKLTRSLDLGAPTTQSPQWSTPGGMPNGMPGGMSTGMPDGMPDGMPAANGRQAAFVPGLAGIDPQGPYQVPVPRQNPQFKTQAPDHNAIFNPSFPTDNGRPDPF